MVRSQKYLYSAEMISMLLDIKKKRNKRRFRDCIKGDSEKRDIENKEKIAFVWFNVFKYSNLLFMKQQLSFYNFQKF